MQPAITLVNANRVIITHGHSGGDWPTIYKWAGQQLIPSSQVRWSSLKLIFNESLELIGLIKNTAEAVLLWSFIPSLTASFKWEVSRLIQLGPFVNNDQRKKSINRRWLSWFTFDSISADSLLQTPGGDGFMPSNWAEAWNLRIPQKALNILRQRLNYCYCLWWAKLNP